MIKNGLGFEGLEGRCYAITWLGHGWDTSEYKNKYCYFPNYSQTCSGEDDYEGGFLFFLNLWLELPRSRTTSCCHKQNNCQKYRLSEFNVLQNNIVKYRLSEFNVLQNNIVKHGTHYSYLETQNNIDNYTSYNKLGHSCTINFS